MSATCPVCYESTQMILGAKCPTCQNSCCVACESQFEKDTCPFCRSKLSKWFDRIVSTPTAINAYLKEYNRVEHKKRSKFFLCQMIASQLLVGNLNTYDYIQRDDISNEEVLNILITLRQCLYNLKHVEDIEYLLCLIEYLWSKLDDYDSFDIDMNYISNTLEEEQKKQHRKYQKQTYKYLSRSRKHIKIPKTFNRRG